MTKYQRNAYVNLAKKGINPSMRDHNRIAVASLMKAGVPEKYALMMTAASLRNLREEGVNNPKKNNNPWNNKD